MQGYLQVAFSGCTVVTLTIRLSEQSNLVNYLTFRCVREMPIPVSYSSISLAQRHGLPGLRSVFVVKVLVLILIVTEGNRVRSLPLIGLNRLSP